MRVLFIVGIMLKLESVSKNYTRGWLVKKRSLVVRDINLNIEPESFLGLVGASGSGKSTLAKLVLGLIRPDGGKIWYGDKNDLLALSPAERRRFRKDVQFVAQHPETVFNPRLKIRNSLEEVTHHFRLCRPGDEEALLAPLLSKLQLNASYLDRFPYQLSGGEIQRLALARALLPEPKLVILDEATSMLDVSVQAHLVHLLKEIHASRQASFLFITHNLPLAEKICGKIYEIEDGRLSVK